MFFNNLNLIVLMNFYNIMILVLISIELIYYNLMILCHCCNSRMMHMHCLEVKLVKGKFRIVVVGILIINFLRLHSHNKSRMWVDHNLISLYNDINMMCNNMNKMLKKKRSKMNKSFKIHCSRLDRINRCLIV